MMEEQPQYPGLREHLQYKREAMLASARNRPRAQDWEEEISAQCVADDITGVRKLSVRDWKYIGDGGPGIGGNDLGPTSPELLLGVISTCFTHTILCLAAMRGIPLDRVRVDVTAINNDANFFGVPSEMGWVPRDITIRADVAAQELDSGTIAGLVRDAEETCPVMQLLRTVQSTQLVINGSNDA